MFDNRKKKQAEKIEEEDFLYMNPVDAAYYRKPHLTIYILSVGTIIAFLCIIFWAAIAEIDEVAKAEGKVTSSQGTQVIENLEGGILKELLVREGTVVNQNTLLARISNEVSSSEFQTALSKSNGLKAQIARLEAEINEKELVFDPKLLLDSPHSCEDEKNIYEANKNQLAAELLVFQSEYTLKKQEADNTASKQKALQDNLKLAKDDLSIARQLASQELYSKVDLINKEQEVVKLEGELKTLIESLPQLNQQAILAEQKLQLHKTEVKTKKSEELTRARSELNVLQQSITLGTDRLIRSELRSPVPGTVKRIMVNTIGAVIQPGMPIMEIVPLDDTLLIEAKIKPTDIAFIQPQQNALVKITAYDFSIYGGLEGVVETISGDTIEDKNNEVYYLANIRTKASLLEHKGQQLPIIPGMVATVDILTGKKTILNFILKPILKTKNEAFTER